MQKIPVSNRLMDLQNYPRGRKSKRIQQPEALDSKTCSTFPVMAGSSFVRMSDGQVLPLQLLKFSFLCRIVYNWKASPTHCDGRQWATGRGTGTGTARLGVTCILNTASGWHQLNPGDCGRQLQVERLAIVRFQSSTMKYPKVPYTWIRRYKEIHQGTRLCTSLYRLIQVYRTFGYFIVLPCTVMYPVTGNQGIAVLEIRVNTGMYQYVLVHTSSY